MILKIISKYGLAAHLGFLAASPVAFAPFLDAGAVGRLVLWLSLFVAVWMFFDPSLRMGEHSADARKRVAMELVRDPFLWFFVLLVVFGCVSTENASSFESSVAYSDPFDDPSVTDNYLEENLCMVFENLRFVKGEKKDHVFVVDDGAISLHKSYPKKKKIDIYDFSAIKGFSLFDVLDQIGIPSFRGRYDTSSLTYVVSSDLYVNVNIEKDDKGVWKVVSYDQYDEDGFSNYFGKRYDTDFQSKLYIPSSKRVASIKLGSRFDDVLFVLGMPYSGNYYGLPSEGVCGGTWRLDSLYMDNVLVRTRWIGSDYPMFDINNCQDGLSTYCGVIDIYLSD